MSATKSERVEKRMSNEPKWRRLLDLDPDECVEGETVEWRSGDKSGTVTFGTRIPAPDDGWPISDSFIGGFPTRYTVVPHPSCGVSSALRSQWRNGPHWHVAWPDGTSWCYETERDALERVVELYELALARFDSCVCGAPRLSAECQSRGHLGGPRLAAVEAAREWVAQRIDDRRVDMERDNCRDPHPNNPYYLEGMREAARIARTETPTTRPTG